MAVATLTLILNASADLKAQQINDQRGNSSSAGEASILINQNTNTNPYLDMPCKYGEDNRNSSLCAQWSASDAAKESADWARRNFWIDVVGCFIGILTLGAASAAAWYAREAAKHTETSAKESRRNADAAVLAGEQATQANRQVRDIFGSENRPWIKLTHKLASPLTWSESGARVSIIFTLTNVGKMPAENLWFDSIINLKPQGVTNISDWSEFIEETRIHKYTGDVIFPGDERDTTWNFDIDSSLISQVIHQPGEGFSPWFFACAVYESGVVDQIRRSTAVRLRLSLLSAGGHSTTFRPEAGNIPMTRMHLVRPQWNCIRTV
ncbi:MAG TPA: hypothetical protein PLK13_02085 [Xanthobacteraceae bacterium]|nr:hypothetical protein [Xanthobacteraceae bacterium]HQS49909.1 hypothetical protein [Xanthobacteraceae bacterium]